MSVLELRIDLLLILGPAFESNINAAYFKNLRKIQTLDSLLLHTMKF